MKSNYAVLLIAAVTVGMVPYWTTHVYAQTISPEKVARGQALYDEAIGLMEQNQFADACPKLEEVIRLVPEGVGAKLELAKCYEGAGRLASAWRAFKIAEAAATVAGQAERQERAKERAAAIEPKLSSLAVILAAPVRSLPGFTLTRNGTVVDPMDWDTPIPVDGGTYRLEATATGKARWGKTVEIAPSGQRERVNLDMLEDIAVRPIVLPKKLEQTWHRPAGMIIGGIGLTTGTIGAVVGGLAVSKYDASNANNRCDTQNRCDQTGLDLRRDALNLANASTGLFVVGGVLLIGGIVLVATAPKVAGNPPANGKTPVATQLEVGPSGFLLRGGW